MTDLLNTILPVALVFLILLGARTWEQRKQKSNVVHMDDWLSEGDSRR